MAIASQPAQDADDSNPIDLLDVRDQLTSAIDMARLVYTAAQALPSDQRPGFDAGAQELLSRLDGVKIALAELARDTAGEG